MKELTIEQKAQRYDKIIEMLRSLHDDYDIVSTLIDIKEELENILPELKNEDEMIRKSLINYVYCHGDAGDFTKEEFIAWLEKQGEQKPNELIKEYNFHGMKIVPKFKKGDLIREKLSGRILTIKDFSYDNGLYTYDTGQFPITIQNHYELMEQKPAWSEEDEKMIRGLIVICDEWTTRHSFYPIENCEIEKLKNWLYSLKERYTWKPSDEQMEALDSAIHCYAGISPTNNREVYALEIMKEQLKKLKEE